MQNKYQKLIAILGESKVLLQELLSKYSSFRIGGPADVFIKATNQSELINATIASQKLEIPVFILGGGTNLLISDTGFRGLVVKNETNSIKIVGARGRKEIHTIYLEADSGVGVNRLVRFTLDQGLAGLEPFLGQPGSIGGATYINAHNMKMGSFFAESIFAVKLLDKEGNIREVPQMYFNFGYDQSIIQKTKEIVLSVIFKLEKQDKDSLWSRAQKAMEYRRTTQPTGIFSSGCTFRNIKKSDAVRIATPKYTISAGFLLESVGLKGFRHKEAMFSAHHTNFIIHSGKATALDVLELIKIAKERVKKRYGIELREEIVLLGDFKTYG